MKKAVMLCLMLFAAQSFAAGVTGTGKLDDYKFSKKSYTGSRDRNYRVYVPKSYNAATPVPMIMVLHGCAMDHNDAINSWNFDLIADQNNVIVVFPFITTYSGMRSENCWGYWFANEIHQGAGEAEDLHSLAIEVESKYSIDPNRRYVTGMSSGAAMAIIEGIAFNDYWAAVASVRGLPYGDSSVSVTSDLFIYDAAYYTKNIKAELDNDRKIPLLVINSTRDEIVRQQAAELIRDSHLDAFGVDRNPDGSSDCSRENIRCTRTVYKDAQGNEFLRTQFIDGLTIGPKEGSYGKGHYWSGDDRDYEHWAWDVGPSDSESVWDFLKDKSLGGSTTPPPPPPPTTNNDPIITLNGSNPMTINIGTAFVDPGAQASDVEDGNLTSQIASICNVSSNQAGQYSCVYTVSDSAGNNATALRTVIVATVTSNTAPTLTLLGMNPMTLTQGDTFNDPGATASDNEDGNLSNNVISLCTVNALIAGSYSCSYTVTDSAGNVASKSRTVVVSEKIERQDTCKQYKAYLLNHRYAKRVYSDGWFGRAAYYTVGGDEQLQGDWWEMFTVHHFNGEPIYHAGECP